MVSNNKEIDQQLNKLQVSCVGQYIKSISFESNRSNLELITANGAVPTIDYQMATQKIALENNYHEVALKIKVISKIKEKELFNLKLEYAGLFRLEGDVVEEIKDEALLVNCISLLFPFARREIAEITVEGFSPVLLNPVDFKSAHMQYMAQKHEQESSKQEKDKETPDFDKLMSDVS